MKIADLKRTLIGTNTEQKIAAPHRLFLTVAAD